MTHGRNNSNTGERNYAGFLNRTHEHMISEKCSVCKYKYNNDLS